MVVAVAHRGFPLATQMHRASDRQSRNLANNSTYEIDIAEVNCRVCPEEGGATPSGGGWEKAPVALSATVKQTGTCRPRVGGALGG